MPRPKNTEQRRAQIVEGLAQRLAAGGYAAATTASIAQAAGLSPGLVHYHFGRKREVLLALIASIASSFRARLAARASSGANGFARLAALLDALVGRGDDEDPDAVACWVSIAALALHDDEVRAEWQAAQLELHEVVRVHVDAALVEEGRATERGPSIAAALLSAATGAFVLGHTTEGVVPHGSAAPALVDMARGLLDGAPLAEDPEEAAR